MVDSSRTSACFQKLEAEHRNWLSAFDAGYLRNWESLLNDREEAAFAEAGVRRLLQEHCITVEPNEDLANSEKRPDFRCFAGRYEFYVEVTNISIDSATQTTGIPHQGSIEAHPFSISPRRIFWKTVNKEAQCDGVDAPALVAVTTFHGFAAKLWCTRIFMNWLLIGETKLARPIDVRTGNRVGDACQVTELKSAPFLDEASEDWFARESISGLLVCHPAMNDLPILGGLHPKPVRPFDPAILPQVEFGQLTIDRTSGKLTVVWPEEKGE